MPDQSSTTRTMTISEVKETLPSLIDEVGKGKSRVLVENSGSPAAALVSVADLGRLQELDRTREEHFKAMERIGAAFADVPPAESEAEIARIIAEIRRQDEAEAERQSA